jgi:hypothetical protein
MQETLRLQPFAPSLARCRTGTRPQPQRNRPCLPTIAELLFTITRTGS